jgi:putative transcriptional regulator
MTGAEGGFLTGRILIAMPGIGDPRFERAIIYICAHDEEHALGLALNRPVEGLTFADVLKRLDIPATIDLPQDLVLIGGPVRRENGFVLHTDDYASPVPPGTQASTLKIGDGIALTATKDVLEAIASHNRQPRRAVMALGYAGWGAGQLERELKENVWLTCDADEALLFDADHETKWARALAKIGISPQHLSGEAGRA